MNGSVPRQRSSAQQGWWTSSPLTSSRTPSPSSPPSFDDPSHPPHSTAVHFLSSYLTNGFPLSDSPPPSASSPTTFAPPSLSPTTTHHRFPLPDPTPDPLAPPPSPPPLHLPTFCSSDSSSDPPLLLYDHLTFTAHHTPLRFRSLTRPDLLPLRALQELLFPVRYSDDFYTQLLRPDVVALLAFLPSPRSGTPPPLIAIALASYRTLRGACPSPLRPMRTGYLITLGVHPQWRGVGLGSFLLHSTCALLQQQRVGAVSLHVMEDNEEAVRMYLRGGWEVRERLVGHYKIAGRQHSALLMGRRLGGGEGGVGGWGRGKWDEQGRGMYLLSSTTQWLWNCALQ